MMQQRRDGRSLSQMRDIRITYNIFEYAAGSVLFELGKTKILCSVTLQQGVPHFLKGKKVGWLTAEYAMLPAATTIRSVRESEQGRKNGRCVEISRLIGRSLRTIVDLDVIGERTIIIDCDVLQADGGTRTACITAAGLALEQAQQKWIAARLVETPILRDSVAAISLGLLNGHVMVDLNFEEDSSVDADFNVVITQSGEFVEVQGTAERNYYTLQQLIKVQETAAHTIADLFTLCQSYSVHKTSAHKPSTVERANAPVKEEKIPLFSLKNRLNLEV